MLQAHRCTGMEGVRWSCSRRGFAVCRCFAFSETLSISHRKHIQYIQHNWHRLNNMATKTKQDELAAALRGAIPTPSRPPEETTTAPPSNTPPSSSALRSALQPQKRGGKNVH